MVVPIVANGTKSTAIPPSMSIGNYMMLAHLDAHIGLIAHHANTLAAIGSDMQAEFFRHSLAHFKRARAKLLGEDQPQIVVPAPGLVVR